MHRIKGIAMIVTGAMLWGATGPLIEWTLAAFGLSVPFLLTIRLTMAGLLLLGFLKLKGVKITRVFKGAVWVRPLLIFSIFGMLGVQYSFVAAIEASDAVVATLLQFLAPVYIIIFVSMRQKRMPPVRQILGLVGTLAGLFLLLTNGQPGKLVISGEALFWGILVGLTFSFYTLYPARLMQEWGVLLVVGWSMLFGGILLAFINPIFLSDEWHKLMDPQAIGAIGSIIVIGTVAFVLFLSSMRYISAIETSILSSLEPLTAMIISVLWFGQLLSPIQFIGVFIMLVFVTWLSLGGNSEPKEKEQL